MGSGSSSLAPPSALKGQPPPPNGYLHAPGANSLSTASMPDWYKSYKKGSQEMLPVLMNGRPVMQLSSPTWRQGTWEAWKWEKVQGHICQVQDAAGQLLCVIAPEAGGGRFPHRDVREVIHTVKPTFAGQRESIKHNGVPLYVFARAQTAPITGSIGFRGNIKTHLHMATGAGFEFNASPAYEWNGVKFGGNISVASATDAIATVDKGQCNFGPGVDPCLMVLFAVATAKQTGDCDQNVGG